MNLADHLLEGIVTLFVAGFAWGFRAWAVAIRESTDIIVRKLDAMARDFHNHRTESLERLARLDERVRALENHRSPKSTDPDC